MNRTKAEIRANCIDDIDHRHINVIPSWKELKQYKSDSILISNSWTTFSRQLGTDPMAMTGASRKVETRNRKLTEWHSLFSSKVCQRPWFWRIVVVINAERVKISADCYWNVNIPPKTIMKPIHKMTMTPVTWLLHHGVREEKYVWSDWSWRICYFYPREWDGKVAEHARRISLHRIRRSECNLWGRVSIVSIESTNVDGTSGRTITTSHVMVKKNIQGITIS